MAYKVLLDGNGSSLVRIVGLGDYVPVSEAEALKAERDALAAQVEALKSRVGTAERVEAIFSEAPELSFDDCVKLFPDDLREIRAEAVKNEFGSILHSVANQFTGDDTTNPWHNGANHVLVLFAKEIDKRVKSIRKGEV